MKPVILAISGAKNVGKTTLITNLIPLLKENNISVVVIKHDGHDFIPDVPNTDTFKFQQAGANGTAIFSESSFMIIKQRTDTVKNFETTLLKAFPNANLILLEGFKHTTYPKLELLRKGVNTVPLSPISSLLALISDDIKIELPSSSISLFLFNNTNLICDFILSYYHSKAE